MNHMKSITICRFLLQFNFYRIRLCGKMVLIRICGVYTRKMSINLFGFCCSLWLKFWSGWRRQCNACVDIFISFIYYSFSSERSVQFVPCLSFHTVPHVFWCVQMGYSLGVDKRLAKSPITQSHHERLKWKFKVKMRLCAYAAPHWCEFEFETWNYTEM